MDNNQIFMPNHKFGEYTLVRKLGEGGFAQVWLAKKDHELYALKLPHKNQVHWELIAREIGLWKLCGEHPNIIPLKDALIINGQICIITEYVSDGSLEDLLDLQRIIPIETLVKLSIGILDGLQYLHEQRIIHCDLKPANILLEDNIPRLADFGISKIKKTSLAFDIPNESIGGTPPYISPEIWRGKKAKEPSDIWSVGVILYRMLAGRLPFPHNNLPMLAHAITNDDPESLPASVPLELQTIIKKSLKREVRERYQSAFEMHEDLQNFYDNFCPQDIRSATEPPSFELPPTQPPPIIFQDGSFTPDSFDPNIKFQFKNQANLFSFSSEKPAEEHSTPKMPMQKSETDKSKENQPQSLIPTVNLLNEADKSLKNDFQKHAEKPQSKKNKIEVQEHSTPDVEEKSEDKDREKRIQLLEQVKSLNERANKLGISKIILSSLNEKSLEEIEETVRYFENQILTAEKSSNQPFRDELLERLRIANEKAKKLGHYTFAINNKPLEELKAEIEHFESKVAEAEKKELYKQAELFQRVKNLEEKAQKFGIPLPEKRNRTETVVSNFEKRVAEAEKKASAQKNNQEKNQFPEFPDLFGFNDMFGKNPKGNEGHQAKKQTVGEEKKEEKPKSFKPNETNIPKGEVKPPPPLYYFKNTLRVLVSIPILLSGISFVFWYFQSLRSLLPETNEKLGGLVFWIVVFAITSAIDKEKDLVDKFIGLNFFYLIVFLILVGVNYNQDPLSTKNALLSTMPSLLRTDNDTVKENIYTALRSKGYTNVTVEITKEKIILGGTVPAKRLFPSLKVDVINIAKANGEGREIDADRLTAVTLKLPNSNQIPWLNDLKIPLY